MNNKVRVGVLGAFRGGEMIKYCKDAENAELVAICDKYLPALEKQKEKCGDSVTYYTDFDEFIKHDMDAVVLANYATEHAPFAIKCLKAGKHVFSEVLPCQTMKEAVELVEAVEESGLIYFYGENYCFMRSTAEMNKLYNAGALGELEYAECEYVHNCETVWPIITYGDKDHWRNNMHACFYCTHSLGPIIHITGLRPVKVTGYEGKHIERNLRVGMKSGGFGMEVVELENGALVKSLHGGLYKNSYWFSMYGSKGRMESAREDASEDKYSRIYVNVDDYSGQYKTPEIKTYIPERPMDDRAVGYTHNGGDFYTMYNFIEAVKGNKDADVIDVYEAMDMALPGMFAYRSVLAGGIPLEVPNLRDKSVREKYRNDTACTDPKVAGDMLIPSFSLGNPDIPDEVYESVKQKYLEKK